MIRAELEHFHRCRILDVRRAVVTFIEDQVAYHALVRLVVVTIAPVAQRKLLTTPCWGAVN